MRSISKNRSRRKVFFAHFMAYIVVNGILILVNLLFTPATIWFPYPLIGWGIGIAAHFYFGMTSHKRK